MFDPSLLGGLSPEAFLRDYWQKKPLVVKGAVPEFADEPPLEPGDLAGLACEPGVTSRILLEKGGAKPWEVRYGPFEEDDFTSLPQTHWTVLVQEVDRYDSDVAALLERFRFLPNWRLDDVMVSYAAPHGHVGAHVDSYDVFLVQAFGRRRWQIGHRALPPEEEHYLPDIDVRILEGFEADEEIVCEPGDLLYLPPRVPHHGVALEPCLTCSVGFRAPTDAELLGTFLQDALVEIDEQDAATRYADPDLAAPEHPGLIAEADRARLRRLARGLAERILDGDHFDRWIGGFLTEPERGLTVPLPEPPLMPEDLVEALHDGTVLQRTAVPLLAHTETEGGLTLYAVGHAHDVPAELADAVRLVTGTSELDAEMLAPHLHDNAFAELLATLVNRGALQLEEAWDDESWDEEA